MSPERTSTLWAAVGAALLAGHAAAQTSVKSGAFTDPTVWDTGAVPGMAATVTIAAGHTVGTVPTGMRATPITVGSLTVDGTLTATYPEGAAGEDVTVFAITLTNTGTIRAESDAGGSGGSVFLSTLWGILPVFPPAFGPLPGVFTNSGTILGGDASAASTGGSVRIDYRNGTGTNTGLVRGGDGDRGGPVDMTATTAVNSGSGLLRGGDGDSATGGTAWMMASTFPPGGTSSASNLPNAIVRGGDAVEGRGGHGRVSAMALPPFGTATALNEAGATIRGGDACRAGSPFLFAPLAINRGALLAGTELPGSCAPPPRRAYFDPPDGVFEGGATIEADLVQLVAGSSLTLRDLGPGAIQAADELEIVLAPGGVLDLSGLAPGSITSGTSADVRADAVLLPPGLALADLFDGGPVTLSGGGRHAEPVPHGGTHLAGAPGQKLRLEVLVENAGNLPEDYEIRVEGPSGWPAFAAPLVFPASLAAADVWSTTLDFTVPFGAAPGVEHEIVVTATTTTAGQPAVAASATHVVSVRDLQCAAEVFGAPSPLFLHVEPGVAITAPFLRVEGGQPFAPALLVISPTAIPEGLVLAPPLPTLYVDPGPATLVQLLFDGTGGFGFPVSLQGFPGLSVSLQYVQLTDLAASNGITLTLCF